jgi:hypothetical protein
MKVIVCMFEISDFLFTDSPLGPVTGPNYHFGPFWPLPQGLGGGWNPYFHKLLWDSQTYSLTLMLTWSDDIKFLTPSLSQFDPERVSISVKMCNFANHNIAFLISVGRYDCLGFHFLGHFCSLVPWPITTIMASANLWYSICSYIGLYIYSDAKSFGQTVHLP